jgi:hypothetical protein
MMNFKNKIIIGISLVGFLLSGLYIYFYDQFNGDDNLNKVRVGVVTEKLKDLKRKPADSLAWKNIERDAILYDGDKIFTSENGSAVLQIRDKSTIDMGPLTLVKLDSPYQDQITLDFIEGMVITNLSVLDGIKSVKSGKNTFNVASADSKVQFNITKEKNLVSVLDGQISFMQAGQEVNVAKDQIVGIDRRSGEYLISDMEYELLQPAASSKILLNQTKEVKFQWKALKPLENREVVLEVAQDASFNNILISNTISLTMVTLKLANLEEGDYFWRVYRSDLIAKDEIIHAQKFTLKNEVAPLLFTPTADEVVYPPVKGGSQDVGLEWQNIENANYQLEIYNIATDSQETVTIDQLVNINAYLYKDVAPGRYKWRVQAKTADYTSPWSDFAYFTVSDGTEGGDIKLLAPAYGQKLDLALEPEVHFSWEGKQGLAYKLIIAKDAKLTQKVFETEIKKIDYKYFPEDSGQYFWTVILAGEEFSQDSNMVFQFEVKWGASQLLKPFAAQVYNIAANKNVLINFEWSNSYSMVTSEAKQQYLIEIAKDETFTTIVVSDKVQGRFYKKDISEYGIYFWRVTNLQNNTTSNSTSFEVTSLIKLKKPSINKEINLKIKQKKTTLNWQNPQHFKTLYPLEASNRQIAKANPLASVSYAEIEWPEMEEASEYVIELYKDKNAKKLLFSRKVTSNIYEWDSPQEGTFYFRFKYIDPYGEQSDFSDLATLKVSSAQFIKRKPLTIIRPENNLTYRSDKAVRISFQWNEFGKAQEYRFGIYHDAKASKMYRMMTSQSTFIKEIIPQGKFYWKVQAFANGELIAESDLREININPKLPQDYYNLYNKSFIQGNLNMGRYSVASSLKDGETFTSSESINHFFSSFDLHGGYNYSRQYFFEAGLNRRSMSNDSMTLLETNYYGYANRYYESGPQRTISYGLGLSSVGVGYAQTTDEQEGALSLNYLRVMAKAAMVTPFKFQAPLKKYIRDTDQIISAEAGLGATLIGAYQFKADYRLKFKNIMVLEQKYPKIFKHAYAYTGAGFAYNRSVFLENELKTTELNFTLGLGWSFDR